MRIVIRVFTRTALVVSLLAVSASAFAQATAKPPYEPQVGQAGKDVVWVPTPQVLVEKMLDMAKVTPQDYVVDLGSGDGRTVITAAKRGATALGVEYNPDMVALGEFNAKQAGVTDKAKIVKGDIYEYDFSKANVVTMFLLPSINTKLRPKLFDMRPGTRIVTNTFTIEEWDADETQTVTDDCTSWCTAHLWIVPAKVDGTWNTPAGALTLKQQYQNVSGTLDSAAISGGKLRGTQFDFTAGGQKYSATVEGNTMKGTLNGQPWTATKK